DVTLDADTAHPRLQILNMGKTMKDSGTFRSVRRSQLRFDCELFVLAKEGCTSGRHYWQVDIGQRRSWTLGITSGVETRKGTLTLSPENGFWTIGLMYGVDYWAYTIPWCSLGVSGKLQRVGVFLDLPGKELRFYDVREGRALHTFSMAGGSSQAETFFPFFSMGPAGAKPENEPQRIVEGFEDEEDD
ncbi:BT1A1 protein, partial [Psilopogon haemacephalus]|nr:BT1A1 protein [Psilopogon haemacephalus]